MSSNITFDAELLRRYDQPGPRYTSYPTAPAFATDFGAAQLREQARRTNEEPIPRAAVAVCARAVLLQPLLLLRLQSRHHARYLARGAVPAAAGARDRADRALVRPRPRSRAGAPGRRHAEFPHARADLRADGEPARQFPPDAGAKRDFSIELDPRFLRDGDIASYAAVGFSRASLGVQDFDPVVQRAVNREQAVEQTLAAITACRDSGFRSVNVDLIYGLPKQTLEGFGRTLDTVTQARPDRIAIYGYAHMPQVFKAQTTDRRGRPARIPAGKLALLQLAIDRLTAAGYRHIGMDHFALPDDDLSLAQDAGTLHRNFMGYTTHADCDLIGLGVSAISHIGDSFSQNPRELPGLGERRRSRPAAGVARPRAMLRRSRARRRHPAAHVQGRHRHRGHRTPLRHRLLGLLRRGPGAPGAARRRRPGRARSHNASPPRRADDCCCVSSPCASTTTCNAAPATRPRYSRVI